MKISPLLIAYGTFVVALSGCTSVQRTPELLISPTTTKEVIHTITKIATPTLPAATPTVIITPAIPTSAQTFELSPTPEEVMVATQGPGCWDSYKINEGYDDENQYYISEGPVGIMWFGAERYVSRLDAKTGLLQKYSIRSIIEQNTSSKYPVSVENMIINGLQAQPDGTVWVSVGSKDKSISYLLYFQEGHWEAVQEINHIWYDEIWLLTPKNRDGLWVGTILIDGSGDFQYQVCSLINRVWTCWPVAVDDQPTSITSGGKGDYWIVTWGDGLIHFVDGQQTIVTVPPYIPSDPLSTGGGPMRQVVYNPKDDSVWVHKDGAYIAQKNHNNHWTVYPQSLFTTSEYPDAWFTLELGAHDQLWYVAMGIMRLGGSFWQDHSWRSLGNGRVLDGDTWKDNPQITPTISAEQNRTDCRYPDSPPEVIIILALYTAENGDMWMSVGDGIERYKNGQQ